MDLHTAQKTVAKDSHRFRVLNAGRRFGKTILAIEEMIGVAVSGNDRNIAYFANTYAQARDICWKELKKRTHPIQVSANESRLEVIVRTKDGGESTITLRGWESVETSRGQKFDFLVLDEVAMMRNFWVNWREVLLPALTDTRGSVLFISTPKGFNHFYDLYNMEREDTNYKSFHATTYDNPHISDEDIDVLKSSTTEDAFAQEYLADFRKQEGLVYKEFDRDKHLYSNEDKGQIAETICTIDFGYTNPAAIYTIYKNYNNVYWVENEWYKRGKTDAQIAEYAATIKADSYYPDPENPGGIKELEDHNCYVKEVKKGKGSVEAGIQKIRELLQQGRLRIHQDCTNLINEFETYRYPDKKANKNEPEAPVKEHDHGLDSIRYGLSMNDPINVGLEMQQELYMHQNRQRNKRMV